MARAQCLCGDVVWEIEPPLVFVHDCHCSRCRKSCGSACVRMAGVPAERFRFVHGADRLAHFQAAPEGLSRAFCRRCGSPGPGEEMAGLVFSPLGALEGDFEAPNEAHIFAASKAPWYEIRDGAPTYDAFPPGLELSVLPDVPRPPKTPGRTGGSCLCGRVAWEIEGKPILMRYCHCLRCRRARQTSHAANALVARDQLEWTAGELDVVLFKLPGAQRFSQAFCPDCGGKAPWLVDVRDAWNVPLGNLDGDPGARPSEHIFVGSKAPWFEITDDLPQWDEYSKS